MVNKTRILYRSAITTLAIICICPGATAQSHRPAIEVTPYIAYRTGGQFDGQQNSGELEIGDSSAFGIIVNGYVQYNTQWEFFFAKQGADLDTQGLFADNPVFDIDVEYYQLGGTYQFESDYFRPFFALTLGMSRFKPDAEGFGSENFFSASAGLGLQLNATKNIGVRLEGRVYTSFIESDSDIFCRSAVGQGSCLILLEGTTLTQWEARAGVVFRF